jgi:hypothetical protein
MPELKEEYDYNREPELDEHTRKAHKNRSRYFFAMISFLAALLFLSVYLNNYLNLLLAGCSYSAFSSSEPLGYSFYGQLVY